MFLYVTTLVSAATKFVASTVRISFSEYPFPALSPEITAESIDPNLLIVYSYVCVPTPNSGVNSNTAVPGSVACPDKVIILLGLSNAAIVVF